MSERSVVFAGPLPPENVAIPSSTDSGFDATWDAPDNTVVSSWNVYYKDTVQPGQREAEGVGWAAEGEEEVQAKAAWLGVGQRRG